MVERHASSEAAGVARSARARFLSGLATADAGMIALIDLSALLTEDFDS
jgi:chemotaxis signal transduction protein